MKYKTGVVLTVSAIISFCLMAGCSEPVQTVVENVLWDYENAPYGTDIYQTFNMKMPRGKNKVHAIVYIHGGFYYSGNKLWYPLFLRDFSEQNIFATIDYRLIGLIGENNIHMDDMLADIDAALKKIQELAGENGYTIDDFILAGHSAGAHLSLLYGYTYVQENNNGNINIAACVSLAGPADYTDDLGWSSREYYGETEEKRLSTLSWLGTELTGHEINLTQSEWTKQNNWSDYEGYARKISPIMYISTAGGIPPTLLVHGPDDGIVPYSNSARLHTALDNASVPNKLITVLGSGNNHMLGGTPTVTYSIKPIEYKNQAWVDEAKEWMEAYLR